MSSTGQIVGGIIGAVVGFFAGGNVMLGASIGMAIGSAIDPPKGPDIIGPRLDDLSIQTATYGAHIARSYGTTSVIGNIFWIEGDRIKESSSTESQGGKGGGGSISTTTYHYSATFAVGLLHVPNGATASLRKIWIDTDLVYDAASDDVGSIIASNQAAIYFDFYDGSDTQLPNPRLQADKGINNVSGYPGLCYIVINDLDLERYSNTLLRAQVKAEIVVSAISSPDEDFLITVMDSDDEIAGTNIFPQSIRMSDTKVIVSITSAGAWDYDVLDNWLIEYEYGIARSKSGPFSMPNYTVGAWMAQIPLRIDQSDENRVAWIVNHSTVPYVRMVLHSVTGELIWDTGEINPSELPYKQWHTCIENDQLTLAYPGEKIYIVSGVSGEGAVTASSSSTFNIRRIGLSENYIFGADNSGSAYSFTVYRISRDTLTLSDTYTASVNGIMPAIHVVSDDLFYTYSTRGGPIWRWVSGVAEDTGLAFIDSGTKYDHFRMVGNVAYLIHNPSETEKHDAFICHSVIPSSVAKLRDIVTEECSLAGIQSSDIDLDELTNSDVRGYKIASRSSIRAAIVPLQAAFPFDVAVSGYKIRFVSRGGASVAAIQSNDLGATTDSDFPVLLPVSREMESQLPYRISVRYLDAIREYDIGEQYAERPSDSLNEHTVELAIVMNADEAAKTADVLLEKEWIERTDIGPFNIPPIWNRLEAADVITVEHKGNQYEVRLTRVEYLPDGRLQCSAKRTQSASYTSTAVGYEPLTVGQLLVPLKGPTNGYLLDIPRIRSEQDIPGISYGLNGLASGWPGASLVRSDDNGSSYQVIGSSNTRASIFISGPAISGHHGYSIDHGSVLEVTPYYSSHTLSSVSEDQFYAHVNLAAYGIDGRWEIIAFKTVSDNTGSYLVQDILRGMYGTEWSSSLHESGDLFIVLDTATISFFELPNIAIGSQRLYRSITQGATLDSASDVADIYDANNLKPLSPVDITLRQTSGTLDLVINIKRRSRWPVEVFSGYDVPLGETTESYQCDIYADSSYLSVKRSLVSSNGEFSYTEANQIADFGAAQYLLYMDTFQLSSVVGRGNALRSLVYSHAGADPYAPQVILFMMMEDVGLTDAMGNTVTLSGGVARSTNSVAIGSYSAYFDGGGDYISVTCGSQFNFGTNDFTLEGYAHVGNYTSARIIVSKYVTWASNVDFSIEVIATTGKIRFVGGDGSAISISSDSAVPTGINFHWAVCRASGVTRLFVNGTVQTATHTGSVSIPNDKTTLRIGANCEATPGDYLLGYQDAIRFTKAARYVSSFTPPITMPTP